MASRTVSTTARHMGTNGPSQTYADKVIKSLHPLQDSFTAEQMGMAYRVGFRKAATLLAALIDAEERTESVLNMLRAVMDEPLC